VSEIPIEKGVLLQTDIVTNKNNLECLLLFVFENEGLMPQMIIHQALAVNNLRVIEQSAV
jgi:hypothetical protein